MISRPNNARNTPRRAGWLLGWAVVLVALGLGVALALRFGPLMTPLLDASR